MSRVLSFYIGAAVLAATAAAPGQSGNLNVPATVVAGTEFSIQSAGSGNAILYIVGPGQALRRNVRLGQPIVFSGGDLDNAGRYLAVLVSQSATATEEFEVLPAGPPAMLSFLARPSRLPVDLQNGITGAVYVFDAFENLITVPASVNFQLLMSSEPAQSRTVTTRQGAAWTQMNSASREGSAKFVVQTGNVSSIRMIEQVPGDPCGLKMNARRAGDKIELETDPLRDCSGNPVTDGTIVTFTENWSGGQTTVDVPLKQGFAKTEVPAYNGARISVASGVVMGNEIRWEN